jgi:hypothetical protein
LIGFELRNEPVAVAVLREADRELSAVQEAARNAATLFEIEVEEAVFVL